MAILSSGTADAALESAVGKLARVLLPEEGIVDIDLGGEPGSVGLLRGAAAAGDVVHIEYVSIATGETTQRDIEPWRVFAALGNWYVTAYCRLAGGERIFRVDRIRSATSTGATFDPPREPPPAGVRYTAGVDDTVVRIALDRSAGWVTDYYPVREVSGRHLAASSSSVRRIPPSWRVFAPAWGIRAPPGRGRCSAGARFDREPALARPLALRVTTPQYGHSGVPGASR